MSRRTNVSLCRRVSASGWSLLESLIYDRGSLPDIKAGTGVKLYIEEIKSGS